MKSLARFCQRILRTRISKVSLVALVTSFVLVRSFSRENLGIYDELAYLERGIDFLRGAPLSFDDSPAHSMIYLLLDLITPGTDIATLYLFGRAVSAAIISLATFLALRLVTTFYLALTGMALVGISGITYVWPGVFTVTSSALVLSTAILLRPRPHPISLLGVGAMLWLASAARPEFVLVAVIGHIFVIARFFSVKSGMSWNNKIGYTLASVPFPAVLLSSFGRPGETGRGLVAVWQHYALRQAPDGIDPWTQGYDVFRSDFPSANSPIQMLIENPLAYLQHIGANALEFVPRVVRDGYVYNENDFLSVGSVNIDTVIRAVSLLALLLPIVIILWLRIRDIASKGLLTVRPEALWAASLTLLVLATTFLSSLLIFPRSHYLQPVFILFVFWSVYCLGLLNIRLGRNIKLFLVCTVMASMALSGLKIPGDLRSADQGLTLIREIQRISPARPLVTDPLVRGFLPEIATLSDLTVAEFSGANRSEKEEFFKTSVDLVDLESFKAEFPGVENPEAELSAWGFTELQGTDIWVKSSGQTTLGGPDLTTKQSSTFFI